MTPFGFLNDDINFSTFLLLGILLLIGGRLVQSDQKLRDLGKRFAIGAFFLFTALLAANRQLTGAEAWVAILIRSVVFAGIVLGAAWVLFPAAVFSYRNTFGLAFRGYSASGQAMKRRASQRQAERDRQSAAVRERAFQEQEAIRLAQRDRERETLLQKRQQEELVRAEYEREQKFHRLREETIGLFLKHHALLEQEFSVSSIVDEFEKWRSSLNDFWTDFLRFTRHLQYRIQVGAARNNLVNDYCRAEPIIAPAFPRDQFLLLVDEALGRDRGDHDVEACLQRLTSLHDKVVTLFHDRSPEWQAQSDATRADSYANAFAETDNEPEREVPFDDDNRLTYQRDAG